jgi:hypothetical protein
LPTIGPGVLRILEVIAPHSDRGEGPVSTRTAFGICVSVVLIRGTNVCGDGSYGYDSESSERETAICP